VAGSKLVPAAPSGAKVEPVDGRRQRSERSRAQIIDAMFELLQEGEMSPGAAKVAERANVGLRTVFRHFEDMDSLYVEMAERINAEIMPKVLAPLQAPDWRGRFFEHVGRRVEIFEELLPVRVSANLRRFQSHFLMDEYRRAVLVERTTLAPLLPAEVNADPALFAAIEVAAGFQTWRALRHDCGLAPDQAEAAFLLTLERLVPR
jgi:AcrR family transcriptional regulator